MKISFIAKLKSFTDRVEQLVGLLVISGTITLCLLLLCDQIFPLILPSLQRKGELVPAKEAFHVPRPFIMLSGSEDPHIQEKFGLNSLGYRGPVPSKIKPDDELRIFVVGGSTVLYGAPSIPEIIQMQLASHGLTKARVFNFGVASSTLRMDVARVFFQLVKLAPDMLVFYGGGNDILMPYDFDPRPGYSPDFYIEEANPLRTAGTEGQRLSVLPLLILFHSRLLRLVAGDALRRDLVPLDKLRVQVGWSSPSWSVKIGQAYLEDVSRIGLLSRALSVPAVVALQPVACFKTNFIGSESNFARPEVVSHCKTARAVMREGLKDLNIREKIHSLDLSTVFDEVHEQVFKDGIHIKQQYQATVAQPLAQAIEDMLR